MIRLFLVLLFTLLALSAMENEQKTVEVAIEKEECNKENLPQPQSRVPQKIDEKLNNFLDSWKKSWESRNFEEYASYYDNSFMNDKVWLDRKKKIFADAASISVGILEPISKKIDENRYVVTFYQEYCSDTKCDKGYKILYLSCDEEKVECKITKETWKKGVYEKSLLLMPNIDKGLKECEPLKTDALALESSKKKSSCHNQQSMKISS